MAQEKTAAPEAVRQRVADAGASMCNTAQNRSKPGQSPLPNGMSGMEIRDIGIAMLSRNSRRIENGPDGCGNTNAGAYRAPSLPETESEATSILPILDGLTDAERRDYLIVLLDEHRQQYELTRANRVPLMRLAREHGLSCHDISVVLGLTENAVRAAINRARGDA